MSIPSNPGKPLLWTLRVLALGLLLLGLGADALGIGAPGFGERQWLMVIVGTVVLAPSFLGPWAPAGERATLSSLFQRFRAVYTALALIVFNAALAFVLLNLVAAAGLRLIRPPDDGITSLAGVRTCSLSKRSGRISVAWGTLT